MNYDELVKALRSCQNTNCELCHFADIDGGGFVKFCGVMDAAADAIEELFKAAKAMHTWIFLNSFDERAAYDECGLSDEMNAMLGYGGQFAIQTAPPKEDEA